MLTPSPLLEGNPYTEWCFNRLALISRAKPSEASFKALQAVAIDAAGKVVSTSGTYDSKNHEHDGWDLFVDYYEVSAAVLQGLWVRVKAMADTGVHGPGTTTNKRSGEQAGYAVSTLNDHMPTLDIDLTMNDPVFRGPSHPPGAGFDALEGPEVHTLKRVKEASPGSSTGEGIELGGVSPRSSTAAANDLAGIDGGKVGRSGCAEEASPAAAVNRAAADIGEGGLLANAPATPPAL